MAIDYYKQNIEKIYNSVDNPQWRVFKVLDEDGTMRHNRLRINSPKKLLEFIGKNPRKIYVSVSQWLNPHKVTTKIQKPIPGYVISDRLLLNMDLYIDLDSPNNLQLAQDDAKQIMSWMTFRSQYKFKEVCFSGNKGIKLVYTQVKPYKVKDPLKRIEYYRQQRKRLITKMLKELDLKALDGFQENIWTDPFRVMPLDYTLKPYTVQPIPLKVFKSRSMKWIMQRLASETKDSETPLFPVDDKTVAPQLNLNSERPGLSSCSYFDFITNRVKGTKSYITVLKIPYKYFQTLTLRRIQRKHNLSDFVLLRTNEYVYALNFKLVQYDKLVKILRDARSIQLTDFIRTKHLHIPISNIRDEYGRIKDRVHIMGVLNSKYAKDDTHSYFHSWLYKLDYSNVTGVESRKGTMRQVVMT